MSGIGIRYLELSGMQIIEYSPVKKSKKDEVKITNQTYINLY